MKTVTEAQKAEARKFRKKLPKAPKKPRANASLAQLEAYKARHDAWATKIHEYAANARKREALKKQIFKM